jgi:hypothetical protein
MANAHKIVTDYQQAVSKGDFVAARKLLHDDLSFQGPIDQDIASFDMALRAKLRMRKFS